LPPFVAPNSKKSEPDFPRVPSWIIHDNFKRLRFVSVALTKQSILKKCISGRLKLRISPLRALQGEQPAPHVDQAEQKMRQKALRSFWKFIAAATRIALIALPYQTKLSRPMRLYSPEVERLSRRDF
jgi:hypothetical protein